MTEERTATREGTLMGGALVTASLLGAAADSEAVSPDEGSWATPSSTVQVPVGLVAETASTGTQVHAAVLFPSERPLYQPRTDLGRRLLALRGHAIARGMRLWSWDEVSAEVGDRRDEHDDG